MKKNLFRSFFFVFLSAILAVSCSLNYLKGENSEDTIPEFSFKNADYTKYESSKKNVRLNAAELEQYKSDNAIFAKNAEFETYEKDGKLQTSGRCELISANTKNEVYTLYGNILLNLKKQNMKISADSLNFNKKTEQITSGKNSEVQLTKDDITMTGYGFSASGVSKSFSFIDRVEGTIQTSDDATESDEAAEDEVPDEDE
ncbi:MAG: LPS export ABC transporter periplasmic protein LptC [Treponema sp.]|nr:LPS export ABC transporter periplasmic protein LptC [Treponema sp.]